MYNNINEVYKFYSNDKNIISVGFGLKLVNGEHIKQKCISFGVLEKKISNIEDEYFIPKTIIVNGIEYITDVVISSIPVPINTPINPNDPFDDWRRIPPVANSNYTRPIQGGLDIGIGTLGVLCKDNDTGSLCLLSNSHVLASNNTMPILKRNTSKNYIPGVEYVGQPSTNYIGRRYKNIYIDPDVTNYVDASIATIRESDIDLILSRKQFGLSFPQVWKFATTSELNSINIGKRVYHSGGKTGAKGEVITLPDGRVNNTKLFINNVGLSQMVGPYDKEVSPYYANWGNLFSVIATETDVFGIPKYIPVYPGDSGSVLIGEFDGDMKVIGLTVGANTNSSPWAGTFCRIDTVCSMLNISEWPEDELIPGQGAELNYLDDENPEYLDVEGLDGDLFKEVNGKKYWAIGTIRKDAQES